MSTTRPKKRVPIPLKADDGPSWVAVVITAVFQLWPVTAILGFLKLRALWGKRRLEKYRNFMGVVGNRSSISIDRIADTVGESKENTIKIISEMLNKGYLGPDAYIDYSRDALILDADAEFEPEQARTVVNNNAHIDINLGDLRSMASDIAKSIKNEFETEYAGKNGRNRRSRTNVSGHPYADNTTTAQPEPEPVKKSEPAPEVSVTENTGHEEILKKLQILNDQILDEEVSAKIDRIGQLTNDIYDFVEQNPARASDVRKFMNYYLPTTMKLLSSYGMLERQSYQGENIIASRRNIEVILDTLVHAFEKQLDQLFAADAVDISSDIQVLETMIAKDGLTKQAMELKL